MSVQNARKVSESALKGAAIPGCLPSVSKKEQSAHCSARMTYLPPRSHISADPKIERVLPISHHIVKLGRTRKCHSNLNVKVHMLKLYRTEIKIPLEGQTNSDEFPENFAF
jgi:hypothetical protein